MAAEFVAAVDRMRIGEWAHANKMFAEKVGDPLSARAKDGQLAVMRLFFRDCQEWDWIPQRFDPRRSFATPRSIRALIAPDPRVIADDLWAKLVWAGLHLAPEDLPTSQYRLGPVKNHRASWYPLEMMRAMAITWLFAGMRSDEFRRLPSGCVRWQREDVRLLATNEVLPKDAVCWLDVPAHKTGTAFTKAVDLVVGEAIVAWERVRPEQPPVLDPKIGEMVHFLFMYRGQQIGATYLNHSLIPLLCDKANIPTHDLRGGITSHRARSTIASQLYNAKEPLSLFDLQEWLGHRLLSSTQSYAKKSPTKVAKAYEKAGLISDTGIASMTFSISVLTVWRVLSAHSIDQRDQFTHSCWKEKQTCYICYKRFPSVKRNEQQSKMESRPWRNYAGSLRMCPRLLDRRPINW